METKTECEPSPTLEAQLKELQDRVDALEQHSSLDHDQMGILVEIVQIMAEIPTGHQILTRAINRRKLKTLEQLVLPRRKKDFQELLEMDMPDGVLEDMSTNQMKLIQKAIRHITHRRSFEQRSSLFIRTALEKFFRKIDFAMKKQKTLSHGGANA